MLRPTVVTADELTAGYDAIVLAVRSDLDGVMADIDEIYIFRVWGGRLVAAAGVEDNPARTRQLGLPA